MLILGRKVGEKIIINKNITLVIIEAIGNYVKLGFDAPKDTTIDREEIHFRRIDKPRMEDV